MCRRRRSGHWRQCTTTPHLSPSSIRSYSASNASWTPSLHSHTPSFFLKPGRSSSWPRCRCCVRTWSFLRTVEARTLDGQVHYRSQRGDGYPSARAAHSLMPVRRVGGRRGCPVYGGECVVEVCGVWTCWWCRIVASVARGHPWHPSKYSGRTLVE